MARSFISVLGAKLATFNYTDGADSKHDELVIAGLPHAATYTMIQGSTSIATLDAHVLQIMAGATLHVYVLEIVLWQRASATTAGYVDFQIVRLTTAGTGGSALNVRAHDSTDAAPGATGMTLPSGKGTEGNFLGLQSGYATQTPGAGGTHWPPLVDWKAPGPLGKAIRIPAGTANGIAVKNAVATAGATVSGYATVIELPY